MSEAMQIPKYVTNEGIQRVLDTSEVLLAKCTLGESDIELVYLPGDCVYLVSSTDNDYDHYEHSYTHQIHAVTDYNRIVEAAEHAGL